MPTAQLGYSRKYSSNKASVIFIPCSFGGLPWAQSPIAADLGNSIIDGSVHRCRHRLNRTTDDIQCLSIDIKATLEAMDLNETSKSRKDHAIFYKRCVGCRYSEDLEPMTLHLCLCSRYNTLQYLTAGRSPTLHPKREIDRYLTTETSRGLRRWKF